MGDNTANTAKEKAPKKSRIKVWWKGLKSEFKKVVWPDKDTIVKESTAAIIITAILGLVIALVDVVIQTGLNFII